MCVHVCRGYTHVSWCTCRGQKTILWHGFSSTFICAPGIKFKSLPPTELYPHTLRHWILFSFLFFDSVSPYFIADAGQELNTFLPQSSQVLGSQAYKMTSNSPYFIFIFDSTRIWTQGLTHSRQAGYSTKPSFLFLRKGLTKFLKLTLNSASRVARIINKWQ